MENDSTPDSNLLTLFEKYVNNTCSREELEQFLDLAREGSDEWVEVLQSQWSKAKEKVSTDKSHWDNLYSSMMAKAREMESGLPIQAIENQPGVYPLGSGRRRLMVKLAAAAAILFVLSTTAFFLLGKEGQRIGQNPSKSPVVDDIAPGGDKAILTLADGRQIVLDTASNGALARQGGIKVIKTGGQLSYAPSTGGGQGEALYNTITTPKGGQYQLELADGSKVWLNAASSLRFAASFAGKERMVELTGEGYFEIVHNTQMPFQVRVGEMEVRVLGTHFNIDAYGDESNLKTTLVEGSVLVSSKNLKRAAVLKPGQQAILDKDVLLVNKNVDTDEITAWKNGQFIFNSAGLEQIMRQIARWYDVEVEHRGQQHQRRFSGIVSRKSNLSEVLNIMKQAGVKFEVQGRKITVLP